jgi:uncharacterized protein
VWSGGGYRESVAETTYTVRGDRAIWSGRTLRGWVGDLVDAVVVCVDPAKVILFGSVAAGCDGPNSDIDLLVVLDDAPRASRRSLMVELRRATRHIAAPHDLVVTSTADLKRNADRPGSTEYEPLQSGVIVYERPAA